MDALRVVIGVESFWGQMYSWGSNHMRTLDLLTRTCKTLRAECDLAFAVTAMRRNRRVMKMWARRWLGLDGVWLRRVRDLTLAMALREVQARGGLRCTALKALAYREMDLRFIRRHKHAVRRREQLEFLNKWMADALERHQQSDASSSS